MAENSCSGDENVPSDVWVVTLVEDYGAWTQIVGVFSSYQEGQTALKGYLGDDFTPENTQRDDVYWSIDHYPIDYAMFRYI